jgi:precorrin-6B methylase 1
MQTDGVAPSRAVVAAVIAVHLCSALPTRGSAARRLEHNAVSTSPTSGSLACVGIGITLGSHISPLARSHIESAEVVFTGVSDGVVELWLMQMHADVRSLQPYYREGKARQQTYREMVDAILAEVRAGKRVCAVFYGHPGVFAWAPHKAIERARQEGYHAQMEPGISSEDCLYADLGIDPGTYGCQHYEASQFMLNRRCIDPSAWLVLWQVGLAGDQTSKRFATGAAYRQVLVDVLSRDYPRDHEVIVYRAATLPIQSPRIERMPLQALPEADLTMADTLAIAPAQLMRADPEIRARLAALDLELTET